MDFRLSLNWVDSIHVDTTGSLALHGGLKDPDVTRLTPITSPGVSDVPVVQALVIIMSVAGDGNSVVKGDSAVDTVENTAMIELPDLSINCYCNYSLGCSIF